MKNLILLFVFTSSFFCNDIHGQNSQPIKSANLHEILKSIHSEIMEKGYDIQPVYLLRDSLEKKMINQFQLNYQGVMLRIERGTPTPKEIKEYENKLIKIQNQIIAFEKETQMIIEKFELKKNQNILSFTKNKIQEFGQTNGVLIMSTETILYQNDKKDDITSSLLQHIHQSEGYNDWVDSFNKTAQLIQQIKKLDIEVKPMFERNF